MKYAIVLPDGAADEPLEELDGQTPLQAANIPNIDWIAMNGRQGCVQTVPKGLLPGSDVATLSLFGYDPLTDYDGRAPLEAAAQGLSVQPDQMIFRCNFVTIVDGMMADFTAGHITQIEADQLMADLNDLFKDDPVQFHSGVSYRNLMIISDASDLKIKCTPPHDIPDKPITSFQPKGSGAKRIRNIQDRANELLIHHDVNHVRSDLGDNPATNIWLWGQGRPKTLESFRSRFNLTGATIAAVDLIRGIAKSVGMTLIDVPGATGYLDTSYSAKGKAAIKALDSHDIVIVHIESPDEAGHLGDANEKIKALEKIDQHIVGPLLETLRRQRKWKILVAPDHPTPVRTRVHTSAPPPFCFAGHNIQTVLNRPFSESSAADSEWLISPGYELMEYFLKV